MPKRYSNAWNVAEKRRLSGQLPKWLEVTESRFEEVLRREGVSSKKAASSPLVCSWVKLNYRRAYVPEDVLKAVGISMEVV